MFEETVEVSVTFGSRKTFFLKMIGLAEEQELRQKSFGVADQDKAAKEYELNVKILRDLSVRMPEGLFPPRPEATAEGDEAAIFEEDLKSPAEAVERFFATRTPRTERIAFYAVRAYFLRLLPAESFL